MVFFGKVRKAVMGVSHKTATSFSQGNSPVWHHLERSVLAAIEGYHLTLDDSRLEVLVPRLEQIESDLRGFSYEGAALGLTGLDLMFPWKKRFQEYVAGAGSAHVYMVHIGAGEALSLFRRHPEKYLVQLDPVLRWLVMDGYGFNKGFFARKRYISGQEQPRNLSPYALRIFDQGLGRVIWFLEGADVRKITAAVNAFPESRRGDLWCGVGVCCAYAGGASRADVQWLKEAAGEYLPHLALGAATVAKGRLRASNPVAHSDLAAEIFCEMTTEQAAAIVDTAFEDLPPNGAVQAYEVLQQRIMKPFGKSVSQAREYIS